MAVTGEFIGQANLRHTAGGHDVGGHGQFQLVEMADGLGVLNVAVKRRGRSPWANMIPCSSIGTLRGSADSTRIEYAKDGVLILEGGDRPYAINLDRPRSLVTG